MTTGDKPTKLEKDFLQAFNLLYVFQWWATLDEADRSDHLRLIAKFCNEAEPAARRARQAWCAISEDQHDWLRDGEGEPVNCALCGVLYEPAVQHKREVTP